MKAFLLPFAAMAMASCVTADKTFLPDGRQGLSIDCSGSALNWGMCERKAGDICKERGYDVVSAKQDGAPIVWGQANQASGAVYAGAVINRTLLIACK
jgi:hypothetical protein